MEENQSAEIQNNSTAHADKSNFISRYGTPISILLGALIIAGAIYVTKSETTLTPEKRRVNVSVDDDPFLGKEDAPVIIIEFSDFQCQFCRKLWREILPEIKEKYIDTGKVKFVYRDFPIENIHPMAQKSAEAAQCANDQGKFWQYHDIIFENQNKRGQGTIQYSVDDLKKWGAQIGLDMTDFDTCLDSNKYAQEVQKDLQDGLAAGVTGTPATFINGRLIEGAEAFANFQQIIEEEL
ncbi:MAG: DsbA family protein [bacterium]|nr:DsbA family protein [bacterium]